MRIYPPNVEQLSQLFPNKWDSSTLGKMSPAAHLNPSRPTLHLTGDRQVDRSCRRCLVRRRCHAVREFPAESKVSSDL
jgi:hypothetical protein